jgi:hypothetical protein
MIKNKEPKNKPDKKIYKLAAHFLSDLNAIKINPPATNIIK